MNLYQCLKEFSIYKKSCAGQAQAGAGANSRPLQPPEFLLEFLFALLYESLSKFLFKVPLKALKTFFVIFETL